MITVSLCLIEIHIPTRDKKPIQIVEKNTI
jgi:hypothetical protein